jgi:hypothetical protein
VSATLLIAGASLVAILLLAWISARLGLGGEPRIRDADHARQLADDALCGFTPTEIAIDRAGAAALLRDRAGRVMLLRRHGVHFAARLLEDSASVRLERERLVVAPADRWFGTAALDFGAPAPRWVVELARR